MPSCVNIPARGHKRPANGLSAGRMMRRVGITLANKGKEFVKNTIGKETALKIAGSLGVKLK